jgi:hypothetical protein
VLGYGAVVFAVLVGFLLAVVASRSSGGMPGPNGLSAP